MKLIESSKNPLIKTFKKLHQKKYRDENNLYLIEGEHLVEEALKSNHAVEWLITTEAGKETYSFITSELDHKLLIVTDTILKQLSQLPTPQPIIAVLPKKNDETKSIKEGHHYLLLDNVQDPGNVGTMIRTADAAGFKQVVLGNGCADIYNVKVQRAMQGSQFHIDINVGEIEDKVRALQEKGICVVATALDEDAMSFKDLGQLDEAAIIMGNEGQGVSGSLLRLADKTVYIPMKGQSESLNVAIAAGIMMFSL